jgi:peptidoglycan/LPS O-acetylase OafA/YrhL
MSIGLSRLIERSLSGLRPGPADGRIAQLDGLRGILALQVAFFHLTSGLVLSNAVAREWVPVLMNRWIAVDVFFAMSGFVMCHVYRRRFDIAVGWRDYWRFIWARFARIVPVNFVVMALFVILLLPTLWGTDRLLSSDGRYWWGSGIAGFLLMQGPIIDHRTWNYPSWSVSVEWCLYFAFPFLPFFVRGRLLSWMLMAACCLSAFVLYEMADPVTNGAQALLRGALLFVCGAAVHQLRDEPLFASTLVMAGLLVGTLALLSFPQTEYLAVFMVPLVVLSALRNRPLATVLSWPILRFLGTISYSLYMVHALVQIVIANRLHDVLAARFGDSTGLAFLTVGIGMALSILTAMAMVVLVEQPARDWLRRLDESRSGPALSASKPRPKPV